MRLPQGEVAEWSNAPVSKTGIPQGIEGSNPSLSEKSFDISWLGVSLFPIRPFVNRATD